MNDMSVTYQIPTTAFFLWWGFLYVKMVRSSVGWLRFFTCTLWSYAFALYLPLLALGPAGSAFFKYIRDEINEIE